MIVEGSTVPSSMHYALLLKENDYTGYYVMNYSDIIRWLNENAHRKDIKFKVLEVYPMNISHTISLSSSKWAE